MHPIKIVFPREVGIECHCLEYFNPSIYWCYSIVILKKLKQQALGYFSHLTEINAIVIFYDWKQILHYIRIQALLSKFKLRKI